jgi:phospholipase/lecithinase/hemolysin
MVHPTTATHNLLALQFASALGLVPEPAVSGLLLVAFAAMVVVLNRQRRSSDFCRSARTVF